MSVVQRLQAAGVKTTADAVKVLVHAVESLEQRVAELEAGSEAFDLDGLTGALVARVEQEGVGAGSAEHLPPVSPKSPADIARSRGWDPDTYLAEGEDPETIDGAIIMARRAVCEQHSADTYINAESGDNREYKGIPENMSEDEFSNAQGLTVALPTPSVEAKLAWAESAEAVMGPVPADFGLRPDEAIEAYRKGGPLWLAMYDHDYLMSLPFGMRQAMAESVVQYAPNAGADLAADILRADDAASREFAQSIISGGEAE